MARTSDNMRSVRISSGQRISVRAPVAVRSEGRPVVGRHTAGRGDSGAALSASSQQLSPRQSPRSARRNLLPVLGTLAALTVAAGTAAVLQGSGKVSASSANHPAAYSAGMSSVTAKPEPAIAGSPVMVGYAGIAGISPAGHLAHSPSPRKATSPATPAPAAAPATQPPSLVSTLQDLPVDTELTGSQAVAWAKAALAALGAPATSANVQTMLGWFSNEGTPHDYNNPLNLNTPYGGSTTSTADGDPPDIHIQAYPTPADFADAFAIQIGDNPSYPAITAALRSGIGLEGSAASPEIASELSVYSGGGYDSIPGQSSGGYGGGGY